MNEHQRIFNSGKGQDVHFYPQPQGPHPSDRLGVKSGQPHQRNNFIEEKEDGQEEEEKLQERMNQIAYNTGQNKKVMSSNRSAGPKKFQTTPNKDQIYGKNQVEELDDDEDRIQGQFLSTNTKLNFQQTNLPAHTAHHQAQPNTYTTPGYQPDEEEKSYQSPETKTYSQSPPTNSNEKMMQQRMNLKATSHL